MDCHDARPQARTQAGSLYCYLQIHPRWHQAHTCSQSTDSVSFGKNVTSAGNGGIGIAHLQCCTKFALDFQTARHNSTIGRTPIA